MAGFVKVGNNKYLGTITLETGHADVENGVFLEINWSTGMAATPGSNTVISYFVENIIDTVDEDLVNDLNYVISAGEYLRLKRLLPGEMFVTTKYSGTAPSAGDEVDIGTTGMITATSGSPSQKFVVKEVVSLWGTTAYVCYVLDE